MIGNESVVTCVGCACIGISTIYTHIVLSGLLIVILLGLILIDIKYINKRISRRKLEIDLLKKKLNEERQ